MKILSAALLVLVGVVGTAPAEAAKLLNVGDPAPELKVARWIKGDPIKAMAKDHVYVLEFWATWCGPCKQVMPHITELAEKYRGKVTFVGVNVLEDQAQKQEELLTKIAKFVDKMGDKMGYTVAADGTANFMVKNWLEAAVEDGIPVTYIVDGEGRIAWIGHPMDLEGVLEAILKGKFNNATLAANRRKEKEPIFRERQVMAGIGELLKQNKFKEAVAEVDSATTANPELKKKLALLRFRLLLKVDETAAYAFARELAAGDRMNDSGLLFQLALTILETPSLKSPDFALAVACAKKSDELTEGRAPGIGATLAAAYFKSGEHAKAVEIMEKVVERADNVPNFPEQGKKFLQQKLEEYKKGDKTPAKP